MLSFFDHSVRMQENRYRHFSLIKAFQSQSRGREGKEGGRETAMLHVYLLLLKLSFQLGVQIVEKVKSTLHAKSAYCSLRAALYASLSSYDQFNLQYQHAGCHELHLSLITHYGECIMSCIVH